MARASGAKKIVLSLLVVLTGCYSASFEGGSKKNQSNSDASANSAGGGEGKGADGSSAGPGSDGAGSNPDGKANGAGPGDNPAGGDPSGSTSDSSTSGSSDPASVEGFPIENFKNDFTFNLPKSISVNTGELSARYSELLSLPLKVEGAQGKVVFALAEGGGSPTLKIADTELQWRPGYTDTASGKYLSEAGKYRLVVKATDANGKVARAATVVVIRELKWSHQILRSTNEDEMKTTFSITQAVDTARKYTHVNQFNGQALMSTRCVSFDPEGGSLTLDSEPTVTALESAGEVSKFELKMTHQLTKQPQDNTVYVTWLNFAPSPDSISSNSTEKAKPIFFFYTYARCRNSSLTDEQCKRQALQPNSSANFYYCSQYVRNPSNIYAELSVIYCATAAKYGIKPTGC